MSLSTQIRAVESKTDGGVEWQDKLLMILAPVLDESYVWGYLIGSFD